MYLRVGLCIGVYTKEILKQVLYPRNQKWKVI